MGKAPLLDVLTQAKRRETAGSDVSARFDFQKNWALCEMLKRHEQGIEYLVAFEFHDDVLFFAPEASPSEVDFFQVKTSKAVKPRTISSIASGKSPTVIGKMATNANLTGPPFTVRLMLVSNIPFEFSAEDVSGADMKEPHKAKLLKALEKEFPSSHAELLSKLHFIVVNLPVDDMDAFVKGKAVELFEKRFGLNFTQNPTSWLRLIQGEIRRRNNYPDDKIKCVQDLIDNKCVGRSLIEQTLDSVEKQHRIPPDLSFIRNQLEKEGWTVAALGRLSKAISVAASDYNDPTNIECRKLTSAIDNFLSTVDVDTAALSKLLDDLFTALEAEGAIPEPYKDKMTVSALGVLVYYEKL